MPTAAGQPLPPDRAAAPPHTTTTAAAQWPFVSIVIPCLNEERFIGQTLAKLAAQYEADRCEIIIVDGLSTDGTRAVIAEFAARQPELSVRVLDNPARHIPVAINRGVAAARGEIIVRMDAHSVPSAGYVRRCVELLRAGRGDVVGTPWRISASRHTPTARAIALAVAHPFGIGDAKYRTADGAGAQLVDTVPFGVFRKELWQALGGYNEALLANEDYDFNYRVRQRGGRVLLDTAEHCTYFARPTLAALARQYFNYGHWKAQMLKLHPRSIRLRQLVAPAFVVANIGLLAVGAFWRPALGLWLLLWGAYLALALIFALQLAWRARAWPLVPALIFVFPVIHIAWGGGFLLGWPRA